MSARPDREGTVRPAHEDLEEYAGGEIQSYRGRVNGWLLAVYAALAVWGIYYTLRYWGGLGPGLAPGQ